MAEQLTYTVPDIHCDACSTSIRDTVRRVPGVDDIAVDLAAKRVVVTGSALNDAQLRDAIETAGFELA